MKEEGKNNSNTTYELNSKGYAFRTNHSVGHKNMPNTKVRNFLDALSLVRSSVNLKMNIISTDYQRNIFEFSQTNADNSKDEKVIKYIRNPVEKNVIKVGNNLRKIKPFHQSYNSSINIPYKMEVILRPILKQITEIEEEIEIVSPKDKLNLKRENAYTSKNKCSTVHTGQTANSAHMSSPIDPVVNELKDFASHMTQDNKEDELLDLDEEKEINIAKCSDKRKIKHLQKTKEDDSISINNINTHVHLNFSNLNIVNPHDISYPHNNSKMLIVDSLSSNKNSFINNLIMSKRRKNSQRTKRHRDDYPNYDKSEDGARPYFGRGLKDSSDFYMRTSLDRDNTTINEFARQSENRVMRIRRKHFKSEIIDNRMLIESKVLKTEEGVNTNLLNKFNRAEHTNKSSNKSIVQLKDECEYEIEMINFLTDNEREATNGDLEYVTPKDRIRRRNRITDLKFESTKRRHSYSSFTFNSFDSSCIYTVYDLEFITNLLAKENYFRCNPNYIEQHKSLKWNLRAILLDWLMEISEEFAFKRDTFHYAVNYIDRFLSRTEDVNKKFLQLLGVASLSIAAKIEEVQIPKTQEYLNATDDCYSEEEFIASEKYLLKVLKWEIIPTTINTWLSWYVCQWDLYLDTLEGELREKLNLEIAKGYELIYFKKPDDKAYTNYRQIAQLIDLITLDHNTLQFSQRYLIAASIFLILCIHSSVEFNKESSKDRSFTVEFYSNFLKCGYTFVEIFSDFMKQSFNFTIEDREFIEVLVYLSNYLEFEFNYNLPLVVEHNDIENESPNYEEFISYQTHNQKNYDFLQKKIFIL